MGTLKTQLIQAGLISVTPLNHHPCYHGRRLSSPCPIPAVYRGSGDGLTSSWTWCQLHAPGVGAVVKIDREWESRLIHSPQALLKDLKARQESTT